MIFLQDFKKTAIIYDNKEISYEELILKSKKLGEIANIPKDTKCIIFMENRPEYFLSYYAIWDRKSTAVCIDASLSSDEFKYYLNDSDATKIFTSKLNYEVAKDAAIKLNIDKDIEIIIVEEVDLSNWEITENTKKDLIIGAPEKGNVALMLYTSGTTGEPKGVMLSADNIMFNIEALDRYDMYQKTDITLALLPLHHIFPLLGSGIVPLSRGATIIFAKELSSQAMIEAFQKYKVTMFIAVPKLLDMIHKKVMEKINSKFITRTIFKLCKSINSLSFSRKIFKKVSDNLGGKLRYFVSGGSKLDKVIAEDFKALGLVICEGYGLTETSPMIAFTPEKNPIPGSAGEILKGVDVKILPDGEIFARGRNVMMGYYKKPEATKEVIDSEGWFKTGDLGEVKDNYIYITGRKKEMIVLSNGKNIDPVEIEHILLKKTDLIEDIVISQINSVLTAVIFPNLSKIQEKNILNIKEKIKLDIIDDYNRSAVDHKKILDVIVTSKELPKTKLSKIKRFLIPKFVEGMDEEKVAKDEPEIEEYHILKEFLYNLKQKTVYPDSHLQLDLAMDSLDIVELLNFIENSFGIIETEELVNDYPTVLVLSEYIEKNKTKSVKTKEKRWNKFLSSNSSQKKPRFGLPPRIAKVIFKVLLNTYFRTKVTGKELLNEEPTVYIGNHQSFLDVIMINFAFPNKILKNIIFMAKVNYFRSRFAKMMARNGNVVVIDINKNVTDVLQLMAEVLREGKSVIIFPEGTRTKTGKLNKFKKSFAILAKDSNVKVQPFGIKGAYEAFPPGSKFPKMAKLEMKIFDKIDTKDISYEEIIEKSENVIKTWLGE